MDNFKKILSSGHKKDRCTFELTETGPASAKVQATWDPSTKKATEHGLPPLTKKLSPTNICLKRKKYFSPVESHWIYYKPHLSTGPMPSKRWPTQNELKGTFNSMVLL